MGYRMEIKDGAGNYFYGTKLYGYVEHEELESYQYLVELGKFDGWEFFIDGNHYPILLNAQQFDRFIHLYAKEYDEEQSTYPDWDGRTLLEDPKIVELLSTPNDKHIEWG